MIFAEITLQVPPYVEFREEGRGEKKKDEQKARNKRQAR
jgi:hypothetical protein